MLSNTGISGEWTHNEMVRFVYHSVHIRLNVRQGWPQTGHQSITVKITLMVNLKETNEPKTASFSFFFLLLEEIGAPGEKPGGWSQARLSAGESEVQPGPFTSHRDKQPNTNHTLISQSYYTKPHNYSASILQSFLAPSTFQVVNIFVKLFSSLTSCPCRLCTEVSAASVKTTTPQKTATFVCSQLTDCVCLLSSVGWGWTGQILNGSCWTLGRLANQDEDVITVTGWLSSHVLSLSDCCLADSVRGDIRRDSGDCAPSDQAGKSLSVTWCLQDYTTFHHACIIYIYIYLCVCVCFRC